MSEEKPQKELRHAEQPTPRTAPTPAIQERCQVCKTAPATHNIHYGQGKVERYCARHVPR